MDSKSIERKFIELVENLKKKKFKSILQTRTTTRKLKMKLGEINREHEKRHKEREREREREILERKKTTKS